MWYFLLGACGNPLCFFSHYQFLYCLGSGHFLESAFLRNSAGKEKEDVQAYFYISSCMYIIAHGITLAVKPKFKFNTIYCVIFGFVIAIVTV